MLTCRNMGTRLLNAFIQLKLSYPNPQAYYGVEYTWCTMSPFTYCIKKGPAFSNIVEFHWKSYTYVLHQFSIKKLDKRKVITASYIAVYTDFG